MLYTLGTADLDPQSIQSCASIIDRGCSTLSALPKSAQIVHVFLDWRNAFGFPGQVLSNLVGHTMSNIRLGNPQSAVLNRLLRKHLKEAEKRAVDILEFNCETIQENINLMVENRRLLEATEAEDTSQDHINVLRRPRFQQLSTTLRRYISTIPEDSEGNQEIEKSRAKTKKQRIIFQDIPTLSPWPFERTEEVPDEHLDAILDILLCSNDRKSTFSNLEILLGTNLGLERGLYKYFEFLQNREFEPNAIVSIKCIFQDGDQRILKRSEVNEIIESASQAISSDDDAN